MPFTKPLLAVAAAALLIAACGAVPEQAAEAARAAEPAGEPAPASAFARWDTDNDGRVTEAEFTAAARGGVYEPWNTDGRDGLNRDEVAAGLFRLGDRDRNGRIAGDERWVTEEKPSNEPGLEYGGRHVSETRRDGSLTLDEVKTWLDRAAVVRTWDVNQSGAVDSDELGRGLVALLDDNRDGAVDAGEWRAQVGDADWR